MRKSPAAMDTVLKKGWPRRAAKVGRLRAFDGTPIRPPSTSEPDHDANCLRSKAAEPHWNKNKWRGGYYKWRGTKKEASGSVVCLTCRGMCVCVCYSGGATVLEKKPDLVP